jgi:hypothetical protein
MQAPEKRKVYNYLYKGVNAKKIEESNEKKRKRILLAHSMQKGMVDNEDDATLSSVDNTEEGFLEAADVDVDVNADEETAEIVAWQGTTFQEQNEEPFFQLPQNNSSSNQFVNQTADEYDSVTAGSFFHQLVALQGIEGSCYQFVATAENSLWKKALEALEDLEMYRERIKTTNAELIYPGASFTKDQCADILITLLQDHTKDYKTEMAFMRALSLLFPSNKGFNLPISLNRKSFFTSDLYKRTDASVGVISYEICCNERRCMVFEDESLTECTLCQTAKHPTRIATNIASYRPLTTIIYRLLSTKRFLDALNYTNKGHTTNDYMRDIKDGDNYKKHIVEMKSKYQEALRIDNSLVEVNILLSEFYDGVKITESTYVPFFPLVLAIINLPPTFRMSVGKGMFLSFIHCFGKGGDAIEKFLFEECLCRELQRFNDGVILKINNIKYFVQVRLIMHIGDTRGIEKVLKVVKSDNSYEGCPFCDVCTGVRREGLGSIIYIGHRQLLPIDHYLRFLGQTMSCCPQGYYQPRNEIDYSDVNHATDMPCYIEKITQAMINNSCNRGLSASNFSSAANRIWYHESYPFLRYFRNQLYYHHMDLRNQAFIIKKPETFFRYNGGRADEQRRQRPNLGKDHAVNGVKGNWAFFPLPYSNRRNISWDLMHIFKNWSTYLLDFLASTLKDFPADYCKKCYTHPYLYTNRGQLPFALSKQDKELMNILLRCVRLPKAYKNDFKIKILYEKKGEKHPFLKAIDHIHLLTVYLPFILSLSKISLAYVAFFAIISEDFSDLMAVEIKKDDLPELFEERLPELLSIKEGLFPDSEGKIIFHQILDLRVLIEQFGPLRNSWAMPGERAMSTMKESCSEYHRRHTLAKQNFNENVEISLTYNFEKDSFMEDDRMKFKDVAEYNDSITARPIKENKVNKLLFDGFEAEELLKALLLEIFVTCGCSIDQSSSKSALFRIFVSYQGYQRSPQYDENQWTMLRYFCILAGEIETLEAQTSSTIVENPPSKDQRIERGLVAKEDLANLKEKLESLFHIEYYDKFLVYGIIFSTRTPECREREESKVLECSHWGRQTSRLPPYEVTNDYNKLPEHWQDEKHFSSWAKFSTQYKFEDLVNDCDSSNNDKNYPARSDVRYGQVNMFFDIDFSSFSDELATKVTFASMTARIPVKHEILSRHYKIFAKPGYLQNGKTIHSYDPKVFFVPVGDFYSTAVAICGFDKDKKPLLTMKGNLPWFCRANDLYNQSSKDLYYLHMLDLHPNRSSIRRNEV